MVLAAVVCLSGACGETPTSTSTSSSDQVVGSGTVVTEPRSVSEFGGVSVSGVGQVILENTGSASLTITAEDNLLPLLESEIRDGVLTLGPRPNTNLSQTRDIVYQVTFRDLSSLQASGVTDIDATGIETDALSVNASGVSDVSVAGTADRQTINMSGTTTYAGERLATRVTTVNVSGVSSAVVNVSDRLAGEVSGSAVVEYLGNPVITVSVSGSGTVRPR
jgi:hypothetical protein